MIQSKSSFNSLIAHYRSFIRTAMYEPSDDNTHVFFYWQNELFIQIIMWVLPVCFLALVPSMYFEIRDGYWLVAILDVVALGAVYCIAFQRKVNLYIRKVMVAIVIAGFSMTLIVAMGAIGLAGLYLFTLSVFMALLFSSKMAFAGLAVNIAACALFSVYFYYKPAVAEYFRFSFHTWGIYVSNYLFLNLVVVVLIRRLLGSIERAMQKEWLLHKQLKRETALTMQQNGKLKEIAYLQSHVVRAPLVNIMGLAYLIRHSPASQVEPEILDSLDASVQKLDEVIKTIVDRTV